MSHIVQIKTQVRDEVAVQSTCDRLGLAPPQRGTAKLFSRSAEGLIVKLPEWTYPVVFDTQSGEAKYDNFNGRWGEQSKLNNFLQTYACEKAKLEARRNGYTCLEQPLEDGSVKLTIQVGGAG